MLDFCFVFSLFLCNLRAFIFFLAWEPVFPLGSVDSDFPKSNEIMVDVEWWTKIYVVYRRDNVGNQGWKENSFNKVSISVDSNLKIFIEY